MSALQEKFTQAQKDVNELGRRPDNDSLLKLYAYFKQATQGDATGDPPGGFDFVRRAKFDAWSAVRGTSRQEAMQKYVDLVSSLKN